MKKLLLSLFCIIAASLAANAADLVASVPCAAENWIATQNYTSTVSSTDNNWKTTNFHNNQAKTWDHIRCGKKKSSTTSADVTSTAYIVSATKFSPVGSIKLTYNLTNKASGSFDSMKIYASETTSFTADNLIKEEKDITLLTTAATKEFTIPAQTEAKYYKVEFTVTNTSTTNGVLSVSGLEFYAPEVVEGPQDFIPGFEANYTLEEETSFNLAANWPANAPEVKYTLSDEDYFYIENNTIEALYAGGPVTVNYSWDATEDWNAGSGSFSVKVIAPKEKVTIVLDKESLTANIGEDVTNELLIEPEAALQYVSAKSSASKVAKYSPETGKVECLSVGTATITLSFTENDAYEYTGEEISFTVTVTDPNAIQFDFTTNKYNLQASTSDIFEANNIKISEGSNPEVSVIINGRYRYYNDQLRLHKGNPAGNITISVPEEYYISGMEFGTGSKTTSLNKTSGTIANNKWTMTDNEYVSEVTLTATDTQYIYSITVHFAERPVVAEPEVVFGVVKNDDESIAHHTVAINNADDDATYEAYINYEDGLQGETKLEFDATTGLFAPIKIYETPLHYQNHKVIQPAHIYNVTVFASKTGATTKSTTQQFITVPRISKVEEEPATRATDKDITVTMHVSDPRVNMFYSIDGATAQTYTEKQQITVPANATITAWAESKDGSLKSEVQKLTNDGVFSGVEEIEAADADAKWYDLQGRAVNAERLAPGIYVKVNGKKAVKVVVK